ncbi:hypothetical protein BO94DRAFT_471378 [Aspergillus sclerotioniger CBS 115572]|uniref:Rhodopsin domain-containing protein n=1 Tax=Aspergillus sclerotioniger CBS 115572 TaxID=1450535 RepID=A0A317W5U7_9EURO|nr:hypothetical protein BO94DRAFT_471378 [Aspergillus sclerotioniger CBS 115572]PWY79530.1 hypothetical protein BO94DRAFT_471378 [Aspergillus sclerotioniger CBS 115572]
MTDHSGAIKIATWFLLLTSTSVVTACSLTRWRLFRDNLLPLALLLSTLISSIISGACTSLAATRGLGISSIPDSSLPGIQKALYTSELFYILTLGFGKLAVVAFFHMLLSGIGEIKIILFTQGFLILWTMTILIAVSLQCHPPDVWDLMQGECVYTRGLWTYTSTSNILIEALLILIPSIMIFRLHMRLRKRLLVIACFGFRALDIIVSVIQLHYVKTFDSETPLPVNLWPWVICSQVLQTTTIVSACVPYLREFLEAFPSGMLRPVGGGAQLGEGYGVGVGDRGAKYGQGQGRYQLYFVREGSEEGDGDGVVGRMRGV